MSINVIVIFKQLDVNSVISLNEFFLLEICSERKMVQMGVILFREITNERVIFLIISIFWDKINHNISKR